MKGADEIQVVEFGLGDDVFAAPVSLVREILDYAPPHAVPNGPGHFLGLTDVHFVYAEGLNMGAESAARGFAAAQADLDAALA